MRPRGTLANDEARIVFTFNSVNQYVFLWFEMAHSVYTQTLMQPIMCITFSIYTDTNATHHVYHIWYIHRH